VHPSTHKRIVIAGLGCGGLLVALAVVALILVRDLGLESAPGPESYTSRQAAIALDSLRHLELPLPPADAPDRSLLLAATLPGDGAALALAAWRDSLPSGALFAFADTLKPGSLARRAWLQTADAAVVDSLVLAARRPWRPGWAIAVVDSSNAFRGGLSMGRVLQTTRAALARARKALDTGAVDRADTLARAVYTIGHRLERGALVAQVVVGLRVEQEALILLADVAARPPRTSARATLLRALASVRPRVDTALLAYRATWRLFRAAGARPEQSDVLVGWAVDTTGSALWRAECIIAVGYGWLYDPREATYGPGAERRTALDRPALDALGPELEPLVLAGRAAARAPLHWRFTLLAERGGA
jgi:hypothetical protein